MIELIDLFFNQYLKIFVGIILVGLILLSLYYKFKKQLKIYLKLLEKGK